ncbi:MAG: hypothetical protein NZ730_00050, partial [Porticoccaceae bacterium]|nr:hypothetical protein [Porticoccaceae bacterium]
MLEDKRKEVLGALGKNSYEDLSKKFANPDFFAGTKPLQESSGRGPLSNQRPGDKGLDITNIPGFENWGTVANKIRK